jgi:hypothetical protein
MRYDEPRHTVTTVTVTSSSRFKLRGRLARGGAAAGPGTRDSEEPVTVLCVCLLCVCLSFWTLKW